MCKKNFIENKIHHPVKGKSINLSREILSIDDYKWLADIMINSSYVECISLPAISTNNAEIILSILNKATTKNSTLISINLNVPSSDVGITKKTLFMCKQIQSRLKRNKKRIFGIHGGGSIGLGLMADIVSKSPFKYHIIATSNNQLICNLINSTNKLWLQHDVYDKSKITCIDNIRMISRSSHDITKLYMEACVAAICVTPSVLPIIANDIAHALIKRYKSDGGGLRILVLMNIPDCARFTENIIFKEILSITESESYAKAILENIEFIPTVVDRIVTPIHIENVKSQLKAQLKDLITSNKTPFLQSDEHIETIFNAPEILAKAVSRFNLQFNLFSAEKKYSMYVHDHFLEVSRFPTIKITTNINKLEALKNMYINGPHAILAWIGGLLGCITIAESIKHPVLYSFIKEMMENEIRPILLAEYPDILNEELKMLQDSFFDRCAASINDPVTRVGRDPLRKLDRGERIRGTIELAYKHNLKIPTPRLEQGIIAGFLYAINGIDPINSGCKQIMDIYKSNNDSFTATLCYCGPTSNATFTGLHFYRDRMLINNILNNLNVFDRWCQKNHALTTVQTTFSFVSPKNGFSNKSSSKKYDVKSVINFK
jgi:hypothetical protein